MEHKDNTFHDFEVDGVIVRMMRIHGDLTSAVSTPEDGWASVGNPPNTKYLQDALSPKQVSFYRKEIARVYTMLGLEVPPEKD